MRYFVITDIHANLEALDVCHADASRRGYDRALVLGDIIGYGPDPNAVIERVQALQPAAIVRGNHDKIAFGLEQAEAFNINARTAAQWTLAALGPAHRDWLVRLPQGPVIVDDQVEICHGSPLDEDEYIFDEIEAGRALEASRRPLCLFGHTHVGLGFSLVGRALGTLTSSGGGLVLEPDVKYLLNPGSVGQPRDGDPRAAYALVDTEARRVELVRLDYPVAVTQQKMIDAGLPDPLIRRLAAGR
jgi:predicted phosphodiesterase